MGMMCLAHQCKAVIEVSGANLIFTCITVSFSNDRNNNLSFGEAGYAFPHVSFFHCVFILSSVASVEELIKERRQQFENCLCFC